MFRKLSAALLATALIAGPAFAADPVGNAGSTPPAATSSANPGVAAKADKTVSTKTVINKSVAHHPKRIKTVKRTAKHVRKQLARGKMHTVKQARHVKPTSTHQSRLIHTGKSKKSV